MEKEEKLTRSRNCDAIAIKTEEQPIAEDNGDVVVVTAASSQNDTTEPRAIATNAIIETVKENLKKESLTPLQITEYCRKLFRFKEIRVMRFK